MKIESSYDVKGRFIKPKEFANLYTYQEVGYLLFQSTVEVVLKRANISTSSGEEALMLTRSLQTYFGHNGYRLAMSASLRRILSSVGAGEALTVYVGKKPHILLSRPQTEAIAEAFFWNLFPSKRFSFTKEDNDELMRTLKHTLDKGFELPQP